MHSLETEPAFRAQTTSNDPDSALAVYMTRSTSQADGEWRIAALIKEGDELTATRSCRAPIVGQYSEGALRWATARRASIRRPPPRPAATYRRSTTRVPPDTQNQADFADVVGEKPVVLLFATPQFCQSRVCGPVVDVAEQVKETYGDEVEFIHMEIFNDNDPSKGVRPQVRAFNLPSEPWLFVIDRQGVIRPRSRAHSASMSWSGREATG